MADIFISYSSKDQAQAEQLIELLSSAGLSIWIDKSGIDVSTSWSKEIVQAIDGCKAFVVLLSSSSVGSENVVKEVSLAAERKKKILPLDLEAVVLPDDLAYHLAGIQRASMMNIDSIIRALGKMGLEATGAPQSPRIVKERDSRKSLMILPFEDLSPTQDNGWFADGLASELVGTLSHVKSLRLIDWNTSRMLRNKNIRTVELARDFEVRYFIEGQVRKFGDQIKISITLLDVETGDHLWQHSLRGTMDEIFDIQEQCAEKVLEGLKLHLSSEEEKKVRQKSTVSPQAFELYLKGNEYANRHTKADYERAVALWDEAVRLDPRFGAAYANKAVCFVEMYSIYGQNEALLRGAESAAKHVLESEGETALYFWVSSWIALRKGEPENALHLAKCALEVNPAFALGFDALGLAYATLGNYEEAVRAREENVRLDENSLSSWSGLLQSLDQLGNSPEATQRLRVAAEKVIPVFERFARINPDDYNLRSRLASVLDYAGHQSEAILEADKLSTVAVIDGKIAYNLACVYARCHRSDRAIQMLHLAIEKGFRNLEAFRNDRDLEQLRGILAFEELIRELEAKNT